MKIKTDKPQGIDSKEHFVIMGIVTEAGKDYACLLDLEAAKETMEKSKTATTITLASTCCYVEEIHWATIRGGNIHTSTLHQVDDDKEWVALVDFVMYKTTIFSPVKIKNIIKHGVYFYSTNYLTGEKTSKDVKHRKKAGLL